MMAISVTSLLYLKYSFKSEQPTFLCSLERNLLPLKLMYFMKGDLVQGVGSSKTLRLVDQQTCQPPDTRSWIRWPDLLLLGSLIRDCVRIHSYCHPCLPARWCRWDIGTLLTLSLCCHCPLFCAVITFKCAFPCEKKGRESWQLCWKLSSW